MKQSRHHCAKRAERILARSRTETLRRSIDTDRRAAFRAGFLTPVEVHTLWQRTFGRWFSLLISLVTGFFTRWYGTLIGGRSLRLSSSVSRVSGYDFAHHRPHNNQLARHWHRLQLIKQQHAQPEWRKAGRAL